MDDSYYYNKVAKELKEFGRLAGLWLKALEKAKGDEDIAKSYYIKFRVKQLQESESEHIRAIERKEKEIREGKLPSEIGCPFCRLNLELSLGEQLKKIFICPNCNKIVDLS